MAWAALAAKPNNPQSRPPKKIKVVNKPTAKPLTELEREQKAYQEVSDLSDGTLRFIILDAGAFISRVNFFEYLPSDVKYYTTQNVIEEVRDPASRHFLDNFPFPIITKSPSKSSIRAVVDFCSKTQDLSALSYVDKEIMALAYEIERDTHGVMNINSEPRQTLKLDSNFSKPIVATPTTRTIPLRQTKPVIPFNLHDFLTLNTEQYERKHDCEIPEIETTQQRLVDNRSESTSTRARGNRIKNLEHSFITGEWVTPSNFSERNSGFVLGEDEQALCISSVGCITTDYHMQNAMIQIGLRLLSLNGRTIRNVRYWIKGVFLVLVLYQIRKHNFVVSVG